MQFVKMHGIGNDYVFVDLWEQDVPDPAQLARRVSPRHFSVGADGLILIGPSGIADVRMRIFNADGSEAEMCGNGIRCVAKYAWDHNRCRKNPLSVETGAGVREIDLFLSDGKVSSARVDMGEPRLKRSEIPMTGPEEEQVVNEKIQAGQRTFEATCVSMGNPHCIVPVTDPDSIILSEQGPALEHHDLFPRRTNVHFAQVLSGTEVKVKTWERGSGATLACGTGAAAVCVAMHLRGDTGREVTIHLPGGRLGIEWAAHNNRVYMTGPAVEVFRGKWRD